MRQQVYGGHQAVGFISVGEIGGSAQQRGQVGSQLERVGVGAGQAGDHHQAVLK